MNYFMKVNFVGIVIAFPSYIFSIELRHSKVAAANLVFINLDFICLFSAIINYYFVFLASYNNLLTIFQVIISKIIPNF